MLIVNDTVGRIVDYASYGDILTLYGNRKANLELLKDSRTLTITKGLVRTAKTVKIAPKEGDFLYIRDRAVSAGNVIEHGANAAVEIVPPEKMYADFAHYSHVVRGCNSNGDFWTVDELKRSYKTFIGKSVFVDHQNEHVEDARGIILDALYNDRWHFVEVLEAIDKVAFPQLAAAVEKRYITGTSMGCYVTSAICSICGHVADVNNEPCEHVKNYKGLTFNGLRVWEQNEGCEFFENSIVTDPADADARIMERVAAKGHHRPEYAGQRLSARQKAGVREEVNQRTEAGYRQSLRARLDALPWG